MSCADFRSLLASLAEAQYLIEAWRLDYNQRRPHGSLGHLTPDEFVAQCQEFSFRSVYLTGELTDRYITKVAPLSMFTV